ESPCHAPSALPTQTPPSDQHTTCRVALLVGTCRLLTVQRTRENFLFCSAALGRRGVLPILLGVAWERRRESQVVDLSIAAAGLKRSIVRGKHRNVTGRVVRRESDKFSPCRFILAEIWKMCCLESRALVGL